MPMWRALPVLLLLQLAGCGWLAPYRIDIQQGNFVSQEMVAQLKRGMTKEQVRFVLGTPLVTDIFHADRWDYVYLLDRPGEPRVQRRLAVFFADDKLARLDGDVVASAQEREPAQ
jgi:outer membrane protein assembly factor BamE